MSIQRHIICPIIAYHDVDGVEVILEPDCGHAITPDRCDAYNLLQKCSVLVSNKEMISVGFWLVLPFTLRWYG